MGRRNYQARSRRPREFPRIVIFQGFAGRKISLSFHEALHWPTGRAWSAPWVRAVDHERAPGQTMAKTHDSINSD